MVSVSVKRHPKRVFPVEDLDNSTVEKSLNPIMRMVILLYRYLGLHSLRPNTFVFLSTELCEDRVYANIPQNLDQLENNIRELMAKILPEMCRNEIEN